MFWAIFEALQFQKLSLYILHFVRFSDKPPQFSVSKICGRVTFLDFVSVSKQEALKKSHGKVEQQHLGFFCFILEYLSLEKIQDKIAKYQNKPIMICHITEGKISRLS